MALTIASFKRAFSVSPFDWLRQLWRRTPSYMKLQFGSAMAVALLVHAYIMTNGFVNHDSVAVWAGQQWFYVTSGRWLAGVTDSIASNFNLIWVDSLFSLVCVSISTCLIGACLQIKRTALVLLLSALVCTFPAVAFGLSDRTEAKSFFLAVLFACLGAYLTRRFRLGFIAGIVLLMFSLAIYQAYFAFFAGLAVLMLVRDVLAGEEVKAVISNAVKYLLTVLLGLGAYVISLKLTLPGGHGYRNIDTLGGFSLRQLPHDIAFSYRNFFDVFFHNSLMIHQDYQQSGQIYKYAFVIAAVVIAALLLAVVLNSRMFGNPVRLILLIVMVALVPPAVNAIAIVTSDVYLLMQYSLVLTFVFAIMVADFAVATAADRPPAVPPWLVHLGSWLVLLFCGVVAINYALYSNVFYAKMDLINKQGQAYSTTLVTKIQSEDYYTTKMPIVFYGAAPQSFALGYYANFYAIPILDMPNMYSYSYYLLTYLDLQNPISRNDATFPAELSSDNQAMSTIAAMPNYPDAGSIEDVDGFIVVKFSS